MDILGLFTCVFLSSGAAFFCFLSAAVLGLIERNNGKKVSPRGKEEIGAEEMDEKIRHIENLMNYDPYKTGRQDF